MKIMEKDKMLRLENIKIYKKMSQAVNPYGDGCSSKRIADILEKNL